MKRFVLTEPAERDLDTIKGFLIEKAGTTTARRVIRDIRKALDLLGSQPGVGHVREELTSRPVKFWPVYPYLIVYDPRNQTSSDHPSTARKSRRRGDSELMVATVSPRC